MMKYRIGSKGAYKNFIGVLVLGVILVAQLLCSQDCTLPYVKGYISKWVYDSLRATWLIRVNRVYGDTVVGDSFDFTAGFIDHVKFDSAVGGLVRVTSAADTNFSRPTSQAVDSVIALVYAGAGMNAFLRSDRKDTATIIYLDSLLSKFQRVASATDTGWLRPTSARFDSVIGVNGSIDTLSSKWIDADSVEASVFRTNQLMAFVNGMYGTLTCSGPTGIYFIYNGVDSLSNIGVGWSIEPWVTIRDSVKSAKGGFTSLAVTRCSTAGKVTLVGDTVYTGILTYRSPVRIHATGVVNDTLAIITRDSSGIILLRAWQSKTGVWYNAFGDSAFYGQPTGGEVSWDDILDKPSCFTACGHNHIWSEITNPPAIPDQYDSASVAGACAWNSVSGKPSTFPPSAHDQSWSTITDQPSIPAAYDSSVGAQRIGGFYPARFADTTRFKACSVSVNSRIVNDSTNAFELVARKGAASGYAGLGANGCVPTAQLGSGSASSATYLRGDQTWATPAGGGGSFNPGAAIQMETMDSWDAVTKYVAGTANRGYWQPVFLSCSLIVTKFMFRGRRMRGSDFGVYDSLGARLWSTGISNGALSALCSLTVTPNLRLGPGQYYIAWACSSASYDTVYGVAQPVAGMIRRSGWKATSCPLPASFDPNTVTLEVRRLWFNLRRF